MLLERNSAFQVRQSHRQMHLVKNILKGAIKIKKYLKIGLFGFLTWLIVFVVSVLMFPLKTSQRLLFESIMPVVITCCAVFFANLYFKNLKANFLQEGLLIGVVWFIVSLAIDLPLFLLEGPMQMPLADYMMDIGVTYLIIPIVTLGFGLLLETLTWQ
jgi:hypothetical protein